MGGTTKRTAWLLLSALVLTACGQAEESPMQTSVENPRYRAALILPGSDDYFRTIRAGAVAGAQASGVSLDITADASTAALQQQAIQQAIANGDSGIMITPAGPDVDPFLTLARDKGLKVVQIGGGPAPESGHVDFTTKADDCVVGLAAGQWMGNRMPEASIWWQEQKKTVLVRVIGPTGQLPAATCRDDSFLQGMGIDPTAVDPATGRGSGVYGEFQVPWEVACTVTYRDSLQQVQSDVKACIRERPDVNGIYASDGQLALAAGDGARFAGKTIGVDVVLVTTGATQQSLGLARGTWVAADARPRVRAIGGSAIGALNDLLAGKAPQTQGGKTFGDVGVDLCTDDPRQAVINAVTMSVQDCIDRLSEVPSAP